MKSQIKLFSMLILLGIFHQSCEENESLTPDFVSEDGAQTLDGTIIQMSLIGNENRNGNFIF